MDQLPVHWEIFWPDMSSVPDWLSLTATMSTLFSLTSMVTVTQDLPGEEAPRFSFVSVKINVSFMFNYWGSSLYQSRYMYHALMIHVQLLTDWVIVTYSLYVFCIPAKSAEFFRVTFAKLHHWPTILYQLFPVYHNLR